MNYRIIIAGIVIIFFHTVVFAASQPAWISDELRTSVLGSPTINAKFIGTVRAGEAVTETGRSKDGEYVHIKTGKTEGWVLARNVMQTPSMRAKYIEQSMQLENLKAQNQQLLAEKVDANRITGELKNQLAKFKNAEQTARDELVALQRASGNVIAIDKRNRQLQAAVVSLEQENLSLKHKNLRLEEKITQKQMYTGGLLVLAGFMIHWLSGLFRFNRSRRYNSFDDL